MSATSNEPNAFYPKEFRTMKRPITYCTIALLWLSRPHTGNCVRWSSNTLFPLALLGGERGGINCIARRYPIGKNSFIATALRGRTTRYGEVVHTIVGRWKIKADVTLFYRTGKGSKKWKRKTNKNSIGRLVNCFGNSDDEFKGDLLLVSRQKKMHSFKQKKSVVNYNL